MNRAEKLEGALCAVAVLAIGLAAGPLTLLPTHLSLGEATMLAGGTALAQSLVRDLSLLARSRVVAERAPQKIMCVESTVGMVGVLVGGGLILASLLSPLSWFVPLSPLRWTLASAAVLFAGLWLKDYVFSWSPWRLFKDSDHLNLWVDLGRKPAPSRDE